jgi:hypothetical protein
VLSDFDEEEEDVKPLSEKRRTRKNSYVINCSDFPRFINLVEAGYYHYQIGTT